MNETESTLEEILSALPGEPIKAADLDFYSLFRRQGDEGRLFFNQRRALIFDVEAMGTLRQQLIDTLGQEAARTILTRFGYAQGYKDARALEQTFDWESDTEWLNAGSLLQGLEGLVYVEPKKVEFDRATGSFHMHGIWHNSYEAEEHLERYDPSNNPVCWILTGYASGYVTYFLGREVLAIETKCVGKGDEHCYFEIRPVGEWGLGAEPHLEVLKEVELPQVAGSGDSFDTQQMKKVLASHELELEAIAEVSAATSTILEVKELLQEVVNLIKKRFKLYHAQVYLMNETRNILDLVAGTGQIGQKLVDKGWRIPLTQEPSLVARVGRTHQGVIVNDIQAEPDFLPNALLPHTRSEMTVPLVAGSRILGILDVQSEVIDRFTERDLKVHSTLASQVAVALRNANLYTQAQEALTESEVLYEISAQINAAVTLEEALQATTIPAVIAGAESAYLLTFGFDEANQPEWATVTAVWGQEKLPPMSVGTRFYLPDFPFAQLWIEDPYNPLFISNIVEDERVDSITRATFRQGESEAVALMPLILAEQWIGLISINWTSPHPFTHADQRLYKALATQSAVVVKNLLLLEDTRIALAETANLYEASRRINEARDLQEIVAAVVETGPVSVIDRALLGIFEYDVANQVEALIVVANWQHDEETPSLPIGTYHSVEKSSYLNSFLSPDPIFFDDVRHDERLSPETIEAMQQINVRAMAVLPLWVGIRQLGILMLEAKKPHHFIDREIQPYVALARQMGIALENQRLLTEASVALADVKAAERRYTVQAWETYQTRGQMMSYEQIRADNTSSDDELSAEVDQAVKRRQKTEELILSLSPLTNKTRQEKNREVEQESTEQIKPEDIKSSLEVSLMVRGQVIGMLGLEETDERVWTPEEKDLVEAIAQQMAQAAENLRLIDESQERVARERRVNEIGEKIRAAQSLEEALQIAIKEVGVSLKAPETTIKLKLK